MTDSNARDWINKVRQKEAAEHLRQKSFFRAIRRGDVGQISDIVNAMHNKSDPLKYWRDKSGRDALSAAVAANNTASFRCLLELGADPEDSARLTRRLNNIFEIVFDSGRTFLNKHTPLVEQIIRQRKVDFYFILCQTQNHGYVLSNKLLQKNKYREFKILYDQSHDIRSAYREEQRELATAKKAAALPPVKTDFTETAALDAIKNMYPKPKRPPPPPKPDTGKKNLNF